MKALPVLGGIVLGLGCLLASPRTETGALRSGAFAEDPLLAAQPGQIVVLDATGTGVPEPGIRYELQGGEHRFCLEGDDPYFTGMTIENVWGEEIATDKNDSRCVKAEFPEGAYILRIQHAASGGPSPARLTYLSADPVSVPLTDSQGDALGGFWAVQPDPNHDPDPKHRDGRLRSLPPFVYMGDFAFTASAMPVVSDYTATAIDQYALFRFRYGGTSDLAPFYPPNTVLDTLGPANEYVRTHISGPEFGALLVGNYTCPRTDSDDNLSTCWFHRSPLRLQDLGHNQFQLQFEGRGFYYFGFFPEDGNDNMNYPNASSLYFIRAPQDTRTPYFAKETGPFRLLFRFFEDGKVGQLQPGEAALFENCGYQGRAIVLSAAQADLLKWNSETVGLDKLGKSIRLGNNTAVTLYPGAGFSGTSTTVKMDQSCLAQPSAAASVQMQPLAPLLATAPDCPNCQLNNADLSNFNLAGADLTGAHFAGATLTNTNLHGAKLAGADFSGAKLSCADFSGTDAGHREDLTQTTFTNLQILPQSGCRPNFSYTHLDALTVPPVVLRFLNLTGVMISGLATNPLSSEQQPLNLSGALLTNAVLDHARLPYADLTQAEMSGASLVHSNLAYAKLYGVTLDNSNLESANLQSAFLTNHAPDVPQAANLSSAFLRNANLSFAQLNGANFTNASFYGSNGVDGKSCPVLNSGEADGCATAHHAVMNNTVFSGAYLFGVDFTNAQATGAVFSNAVLVGANFDHAALGSDSTAATTTSLDSAFLQGANLAGATLDHVSLAGAFVDFNPKGNTIDIRLPGSHTRFPGYWGKAGQEVCAEPSYSGPTAVPATNSTITCPDGNKHSNGCGAGDPTVANSPWNNGTDISSASTPASYQQNATYTSAVATPICSDDVMWDVGGNSLRKKRMGGK